MRCSKTRLLGHLSATPTRLGSRTHPVMKMDRCLLKGRESRTSLVISGPANMQSFQAAQADVVVPFNGVGDKSEIGKPL